MIKLKDILLENDGGELDILKPRRNKKDRDKNYQIVLQKQIQNYIKNGSEGNLNLSYTKIKTLPDNLTKVGGGLYLENTPIETLPDDLSVGGNLYLRGVPIQSLPDNLTVGGSLVLYNTQIQSLPDNLTVGGNLDLTNTPLAKKYTREQLKQLLPGVKGNIYI